MKSENRNGRHKKGNDEKNKIGRGNKGSKNVREIIKKERKRNRDKGERKRTDEKQRRRDIVGNEKIRKGKGGKVKIKQEKNKGGRDDRKIKENGGK